MLFLGNVEQLVLIYCRRGSLSFQFEHHDTVVVAGGEKVYFRMRSNDPESIILPLKRLDGCALVEIPYSNCLVFTDRQYKVLVRVKKAG